MNNDVISLIPKGDGQRITSTEIKKLTHISGAAIRKMVNTSRANFIPIGSDRNGYFIAEKPEDLNHTIAQINSRIHKMIKAREGLKKAQKLMEEKKENV